MAKNNYNVSTIEELVELAKGGKVDANDRFKLSDHVDWKWENEAEGAAFIEAENALGEKYHRYSNEWYQDSNAANRDAYEVEEAKIKRPKQVRVVDWSLNKSTHGYYSSGYTITLSPELGDMISQTWTKGKYGFYTGAITLSGILKKLGKGDAAKDVKATIAKKENLIKRQHEAQRRNYHRGNLVEKLDAFLKLYDEYEDIKVPGGVSLKCELELVRMQIEDAREDMPTE